MPHLTMQMTMSPQIHRHAIDADALPIHMLYREDGVFTMPTVAQCLAAKRVLEDQPEAAA